MRACRGGGDALPTLWRVVRRHHPARVAGLSQLRLDEACGMVTLAETVAIINLVLAGFMLVVLLWEV